MFGTISTFVTLIASVLETRLGHTNGDVLELIKFAGALIGEGDDAREAFEELTARVEKMKEDGGVLSAAEIAGIRERRLSLSGEISDIRKTREEEAGLNSGAAETIEDAIATVKASEDLDLLKGISEDEDVPKKVRKAAQARFNKLIAAAEG